MPLAVNSRYKLHTMTGSQRYAAEIISRLELPFREISPSKQLKGVKGHIWEQTSLLVQSRSDLLWSPCQTGPIIHPNHIVSILDMSFFDVPKSFSPLFRMWYQFSSLTFSRAARHIITISHFSKERIKANTRISDDRISVVHLGANSHFVPQPQATSSDVLAKLGLPMKPYVLTVGSLEPRKNIASLIEAWGETRGSRDPNLQLLLVGKRGDPNVFGTDVLSKVDASVDICFTGYVNEEDLPSLYSGAQLFVYPSLYEGFGLPVLEALGCGAPVLTSDAASLVEVGGDAVKYFKPTDTRSLAESMVSCLKNTSWRTGARRLGPQHAMKFSWERCAKEHEAIFNKHLGKYSGHA